MSYTLKQLKNSLNKFGGDFDNYFVFFQTVNDNGEPVYSMLCSTAMVQNHDVILLGDEKASQKMLDDQTPGLDGLPFQPPNKEENK